MSGSPTLNAGSRITAAWLNSAVPGPWQPITPSGSWTNNTSGNPPLQWRLCNPVTAEVMGNIIGGTTANGTVIFTLPAAACPLSTQDQVGTSNPAPASSSTSANAFQLSLGASGTVTIYGCPTTATSLSFHFFVSLDT